MIDVMTLKQIHLYISCTGVDDLTTLGNHLAKLVQQCISNMILNSDTTQYSVYNFISSFGNAIPFVLKKIQTVSGLRYSYDQ